jgi:hypothetical protein
MARRRLASALSWRCFPAGHFELQHPPPTADPTVPSSPSNTHVVQVPPPRSKTVLNSMYAKRHIGRAEREILVPVSHRNYFFKSPLYMAFSTAADPADRAVGPLSPLPCHAWHGYGVSNAHHGELRGCRRACERTPLRDRRRCAAGGRRPHWNWGQTRCVAWATSCSELCATVVRPCMMPQGDSQLVAVYSATQVWDKVVRLKPKHERVQGTGDAVVHHENEFSPVSAPFPCVGPLYKLSAQNECVP